MKKKKLLVNKKTISIILVAVIVFIVAIIIWGGRQTKIQNPSSVSLDGDVSQSDIIYYYGKECLHCKNVEKFIADNKISEKISFAKKEVWHSDVNNDEMNQKAAECLLSPEKVGVPFLFARGKCYIGEIEVENFLKKEASMQ